MNITSLISQKKVIVRMISECEAILDEKEDKVQEALRDEYLKKLDAIEIQIDKAITELSKNNHGLKNIEESFWWSISKILSYNALFNFIIGARGCGKSFGTKYYCVKQSIEKGDKFVLLRRTEVEIKKARVKFFKDISKKFQDYEFYVKGETFLYRRLTEEGEEECEWLELGYSCYLSGAKTEKSIPFDDVWYIIFDEVLLPKTGLGKYLPDEVTTFLEFYETVARLRDVRVFFLSNALTTVNPYFLYFNLRIPKGKKTIIRLKDDLCLEMINSSDYAQVKKSTRFGKLIAGTEYERYAIDNEFVWETNENIKKKTAGSFFEFTLEYKGQEFGVWRNNHEGSIYISKDIDYNKPLRFSATPEGKKNTMVFKNRRRYVFIDDLFKNYEMGNVYFESQTCKTYLEDMFRRFM